MPMISRRPLAAIAFWFLLALAAAQSGPAPDALPRLVRFSGVVADPSGKPLTGATGITFSLYADRNGGAPLWLETQNVQVDRAGHFTVLLGATRPEGLPVDMFVSEQARWLGVRVSAQEEMARVMMVSVPYALKAADAETLGGFPASAFALAAAAGSSAPVSPALARHPPLSLLSNAIAGSGTANFLPVFSDPNTLADSVLFQDANQRIGIGTTTPFATLDVLGSAFVRGVFRIPPHAASTALAGANSPPFFQQASSFNSATAPDVTQSFVWQAEPSGNNTPAPLATLNLLYSTDTNTPVETGLSINSHGILTFTPGQTFPGTGLITSVRAGTDLTGGGAFGDIVLNLDTAATDARYARLNAANIFTGNQLINGVLTVTGGCVGCGGIGSGPFAEPIVFPQVTPASFAHECSSLTSAGPAGPLPSSAVAILQTLDAGNVAHDMACRLSDGSVTFPFLYSVGNGVRSGNHQFEVNADVPAGRNGLSLTNTDPISRGDSIQFRSCDNGCGTNFVLFTDSNESGREDMTLQQGTGINLMYMTGGCANCPGGALANVKQFNISDGTQDASINPEFGFFAGHLQHGVTGVNPDNWGARTLSGGRASYTFVAAWQSPPLCICNNPNQSGAAMACSASATTTTLTLKSGSASDKINYMCMGNPN
jgi:hypothetical protein